jgi:hypothetical protein
MKRALVAVGLVLAGLGIGFVAALLWPRAGAGAARAGLTDGARRSG